MFDKEQFPFLIPRLAQWQTW